MPLYPADEKWYVKLGRFVNVLDDDLNKLSPVKLNVWAANLTAVGATIGTGLSWFAGHLAGLETVWGATIGYLTHAHITHHEDKKARRKPPE